MNLIPIDEVPAELHTIELQNGKIARLYQVIIARVIEIDPDRDIKVYKYQVPCPVCGIDTMAFSYDGKYFSNIQLNCRHCGVYFRPIVKR